MSGAGATESRRVQRHALILAVLILALAAAALIGAYRMWRAGRVSEWRQEKQELLRAAGQAQPLIAALDVYRNDHGEYPRSLDALVPDYLPALPAPGRPFRGAWRYSRDPDSNGDLGVYDLFAEVPPDYCPIASPLLHFSDHMSYRSDAAYPREAHGGVLERIGEWGYYHE